MSLKNVMKKLLVKVAKVVNHLNHIDYLVNDFYVLNQELLLVC